MGIVDVSRHTVLSSEKWTFLAGDEMAEMTNEEIFFQLDAAKKALNKRIDDLQDVVMAFKASVDEKADRRSIVGAIRLIEGAVAEVRSELAANRNQMELYLDKSQLKGHKHDGGMTPKINYANLEGIPSRGESGIVGALVGTGKTGVGVSFQVPFDSEPVVTATLMESRSPEGYAATRTELKVTPLGFSFRAFSGETDLNGLRYSYVVWNPPSVS